MDEQRFLYLANNSSIAKKEVASTEKLESLLKNNNITILSFIKLINYNELVIKSANIFG